MSDSNDPESKTQEPTEKRRQDARDKGDILRSKDFGTSSALLSTGAYLSFFGVSLIGALLTCMHTGLSISRTELDQFDMKSWLAGLLLPLAGPVCGLAFLWLVVAVGGQALLGNIRMNVSLMVPDFRRLDPLAGAGRMFGKQGIVELVKALFKVVLILAAGGYFLWQHNGEIFGLANATPGQAMRDTGSLILSLLFLLGGVCLLLSGGDIFTAFMRLQNKLRMSREEVKEEHKQSEGSPEAKHYRRKRQREILKSNFRAAVKDASVVVTNPTHFAVALRYVRGKDRAPVVLAKGRDIMAEALREIALEKKIPILPSPSLARALYFTGKSGTEIHFDLYHAVAAVLAFIFSLDNEMREAPEVDVPEDFRFDTNGRLESSSIPGDSAPPQQK